MSTSTHAVVGDSSSPADTVSVTSPADRPSPAQTRDPLRQVPTRRVSFEESLSDLPKYFAADENIILSRLAATLSGVFPDGEDFFVRSVRHFRGDITDPALKKQVAGFIGQESIHGREHRIFNDRLDALGYPTKRLERSTKFFLGKREKIMTPKANLALTAALEHFTATLAETILDNPESRRLFGHDAARDLFVWHALEESEHKAVAFDVYRAVGGSERTRVWSMRGIRLSFILTTLAEVAVGVLFDREAWRKGRLRRDFRQFRKSPLIDAALWRQLKEYDRPNFHPDDHDTNALVDEWREILFGPEGELNNLLATPARQAS